MPGGLPPPPPKVFFGRDELVEEVVHLAERLTPIGLIGAGGIGKTSIALTVLHDDRIKWRFGENRVFIRCDEFPASYAHFLRRLSSTTGAGIENPEDLSTLRPFLSSKEMLIVLDNAESILDPQGPNAREIYGVVEGLTEFDNICLCITSRITTIPPDCEILEIPTLAIKAAHDTFYQIYKHDERSEAINDILSQLDFHPLSITLLATVAQQNEWDMYRIRMEWERQRTGVLHATQHNRSLSATIELSFTSPTFQELGPGVRSLLEVIAFFPQGLRDADWPLPMASDPLKVFDKLCVLSLTYRSDGFVTMLAPMRDYLRPKDPASSSLLAETKERYFARLSGSIIPDQPGFEEARWITTEDVNIEYLLDVFTAIDAGSERVWAACSGFMNRLYWHKPRLVTLGPKIEALSDIHPSKAQCLWDLSKLFGSVGDFVERKRLLTQVLKLCREVGNRGKAALTLRDLSDTNWRIGLHEEGIQQAKEAYEICKWLGDASMQAECLINLASLLHEDKQLEEAEKAASYAINLVPKKGQEFRLCKLHRVLGDIHRSKGDTEKAIFHLKMALKIATPFDWHSAQFRIHYGLAQVFSGQGKFEDAQAHLERAKSYAANNTYLLAHAVQQQAWLWNQQGMFRDAISEASRALAVFEKLGATNDVKTTSQLLHQIEADARGDSHDDGESLETIPLVVHYIDSSRSDSIAGPEA